MVPGDRGQRMSQHAALALVVRTQGVADGPQHCLESKRGRAPLRHPTCAEASEPEVSTDPHPLLLLRYVAGPNRGCHSPTAGSRPKSAVSGAGPAPRRDCPRVSGAMIPHPSLRREVEQWVEESSPPAPLLHNRVLSAVRHQTASDPKRRSAFAPSLVAWASVVALAGVIAMSHLLLRQVNGSHEPARVGGTVLQYSSNVEHQYAILYVAVHSTDLPCYTGPKLSLLCRSAKEVARADAADFLDALQTSTVPPELQSTNAMLETALQRLAAELNNQLKALDTNSSSDSSGYDPTDLTAVSAVVARIDCWPRPGVPSEPQNDFASRRPPTTRCGP